MINHNVGDYGCRIEREHIYIYIRKKEREGKDMNGVDLFEKINIVPRLPLPSLDGA